MTESLCKLLAQLAALSKSFVVGGVVADKPLSANDLSARSLYSVCPEAHPLAVAPVVGAEKRYLFA